MLDVGNSYLPELVAGELKRQNISSYDVAKRAGNRISAATVTKIINREIKSSSVDTLDALALGLGIDRHDVYNAARGIDNDMPARFQTYAARFDAADVSEDEWQFLETIFKDSVDRFRQQREQIREKASDVIIVHEMPGGKSVVMKPKSYTTTNVPASIESEKSVARHEVSNQLRETGEAVKKRKAR